MFLDGDSVDPGGGDLASSGLASSGTPAGAAAPPGLAARLLEGTGEIPVSVREWIERLAAITVEPITGALGTGTQVAGSVVALARVRHALDAEIARRTEAAVALDVLTHSAGTTLELEGHCSGRGVAALLAASRFAGQHPDVARVWRSGRACTDVIAALARGLRTLTVEQAAQVVKAAIEVLPTLSVPGVKAMAARAVDLLQPEDRDAAEQRDWDARSMVFSHCAGTTIVHAELPALEGAALESVLTALAESQRVEGDGLTRAQRCADALITLVNCAATHGQVPASSSGLPVATTITIGLGEAERLAAGAARPSSLTLTDLVRHAGDPAALPTTAGGVVTLGDAAARFALCSSDLTGAVVDDRYRRATPLAEALTHTRVEPLAMGRATRLATPAQRKALALRDGGCVICARPAQECQTHHITPWADGGATDLDHLVLLCWAHHRQVDLGRWTLTRNPGPIGSAWNIAKVPRHRWRPRR